MSQQDIVSILEVAVVHRLVIDSLLLRENQTLEMVDFFLVASLRR
jgi:hypothetical protein